jgi:hypothetical protein
VAALDELRAHVTAALTGLAPAGDDWPAFDAPVDAVSPPCFVLVWPDPWLVPRTVCAYIAALDVLCIAARIDPAPGYGQLEALIGAALPALGAAGITVAGVGGAGPLEVAGLTYQSARVHVSHTVKFPEVQSS